MHSKNVCIFCKISSVNLSTKLLMLLIMDFDRRNELNVDLLELTL
jgi:hypothetical protein